MCLLSHVMTCSKARLYNIYIVRKDISLQYDRTIYNVTCNYELCQYQIESEAFTNF